jgi:hypothetical protein
MEIFPLCGVSGLLDWVLSTGNRFWLRLSENAHLPFDKLMALSKVEGLRYPHPSSLRRTSMYASFLGISEALHLDIFHHPLRNRFFDSLVNNLC